MLVAPPELWEWALALSLPIDCQPRILSGLVEACPREPGLSGAIQREQEDKLRGRLFFSHFLDQSGK